MEANETKNTVEVLLHR